MYDRVRTGVRTPVGNTELFSVEMGLHQGSALSPYLFTLILDELSSGLQEELPWCLIFADDIALISRSADELNSRLEKWRRALEDNGLCVSREKTEYLRCDFDKNVRRQNVDADIHIGERILCSKESFRYLGSVIHKSGEIDEDVTHRIQAGWMKWRASTGVLCDKRIPLKLKGKFYRVAIRPTMLYGSECWPIKKTQASRVEVAEMRMLRWTCGKTLSDRIPTGAFRVELEVGTIINKLREGRLRWFGHVRRRDQTSPLRSAEVIHIDGIRRRGRPKMRWEDRLAKDLIELGLSEDMTSDRTWFLALSLDRPKSRGEVTLAFVDPKNVLSVGGHDLREFSEDYASRLDLVGKETLQIGISFHGGFQTTGMVSSHFTLPHFLPLMAGGPIGSSLSTFGVEALTVYSKPPPYPAQGLGHVVVVVTLFE
uniref:uncharacterized protein LOC122583111 n=1 Tax=Erigeron canadensis TaxID=72917 RepID=UPI001CB89FCD|nr:uncharacterized protein LOC122583111 [Erigeron canadensis]